MSAHKFLWLMRVQLQTNANDLRYAKYVSQVKQLYRQGFGMPDRSLHTLWSLLKQGIAEALMPFKGGIVERLLTGVRLHGLHIAFKPIKAIHGS